MVMVTATRTAKTHYIWISKTTTLHMHRHFFPFLCCHCMTTMWKCLISHFVGGMNRRQQLSFSFPVLWHSPLEFNSRKICQHLNNWTRWNKCDKVWDRVNSLFNWCFHSHHCRSCLSSPLTMLSSSNTQWFLASINFSSWASQKS